MVRISLVLWLCACGSQEQAIEGRGHAGRPVPEVVAGKFEIRDGKPVACASDGTCRPVGVKLGRYLKSFTDEEPAVSVTSDGEVVMAEHQAWSVRKDKRIKLAVPRDVDPEYVKWGNSLPVG